MTDLINTLADKTPETGGVKAIEEEKVFKVGDKVHFVGNEDSDAKNGVVVWRDSDGDYAVQFSLDEYNYLVLPPSELALIEKSKPIEIDGVKKGFDPENLTFDGVEIKEGDLVAVESIEKSNKKVILYTSPKNNERLAILLNTPNINGIYTDVWIPIKNLQIISHTPQKSELEKAEEELEEITNFILQTATKDTISFATKENLEHFYQTKKKVETLKNNNQ